MMLLDIEVVEDTAQIRTSGRAAWSLAPQNGGPHNAAFDAYDHPTDVTGSNGTTTIAHYDYTPFGEITRKSGTFSDENRFRFSTKHFEPGHGIYDFGYRFYHPDQGRWLSRDPIPRLADNAHLYCAVGNAPIGTIDHLGLYIVTPADWAVYRIMDEFEQGFYEKWRDPAMPDPDYARLKLEIEAKREFKVAKAKLDKKLKLSCIPAKFGYDVEDPVVYDKRPLLFIVHKTRLVQYWECDQNCNRVRKKPYTMDTYDFAGGARYYGKIFVAYEYAGMGHPYIIKVDHDPGK